MSETIVLTNANGSPTATVVSAFGTSSTASAISTINSTPTTTPTVVSASTPASSTSSVSAGSVIPLSSQYGNGTIPASSTSSAAVPQTPAAQPVKAKSSVSSGATAGIAIATLLIGAAIGAIVMLVLQKKKKRKSKSSRLSAYASNRGEHGPVEAVAARSSEKAITSVEATDPEYLLPQPKDDQSMGAAANQFFVHIGNHVENFYHGNSVQGSVTARSEEDELLISRRTRFFAIKRHICREMLAAMAWDCPPQNSLLSSSAVAVAQKMSRGSLSDNTYEVAWARWRVSTSLLLKGENDGHIAQSQEYWFNRLRTRLQPFWTDSAEIRTSAQEDLQAICELARNLASLLCSQPAKWEFVWPRSDSQSHFTVFPEFVRTTDSKARRLDRPRRVLEAQKMH